MLKALEVKCQMTDAQWSKLLDFIATTEAGVRNAIAQLNDKLESPNYDDLKTIFAVRHELYLLSMRQSKQKGLAVVTQSSYELPEHKDKTQSTTVFSASFLSR